MTHIVTIAALNSGRVARLITLLRHVIFGTAVAASTLLTVRAVLEVVSNGLLSRIRVILPWPCAQ